MAKNWLLGRIVTPSQVHLQGAVGWEGDRIVYAGSASEAGRDPREPAEQVSGWVTPGLIDLHLHGAGGFDLMDGTPEAYAGVSRILAAHGTTAYLATGMVRRDIRANRHLALAADLMGAVSGGAEVLGVHVEGPFVNPLRGGLIRSDRIWPPDLKDLEEILSVSRRTLRMMTLAPELPGALELLPALADAGAVASLGHTEATFQEARAGFGKGIRHVTHLYNAMRGLHHREPGALGAVLLDHGVTAQIIADGVHVHPDLLRWTAETLSPEALVLITDALPAAGLPEGVYEYDGRPYHSEGGSAWYRQPGQPDRLFGTTLLLDDCVRRAMASMEVSFPRVVAMATLNPARTLGLEKERGTLEPGRVADLVVWSEDFHVEQAVLRGKTAWKKTVHLTL